MKPLAAHAVESALLEHAFALHHHSTDVFLLRVGQLHRIARLDRREANEELAAIVADHQLALRRPFDLSQLVDVDEDRIMERECLWLTPLCKACRRLEGVDELTRKLQAPVLALLTSQRLYLQPLENIQHQPVFRFELSALHRTFRRRHQHREIGLELLLRKPSHTELFLAFSTASVRDEFYQALMHHPVASLALDPTTHQQMQEAWRRGRVSNFDYLMHLNHLADRTHNDLAQYPVFPWVLADYTSAQLDLDKATTFRDLSKPMGALNADRLEGYRARMAQLAEAGEQPFLYGTHYSTPGYVLFFLVRSHPDLMLRLQSGRFDSPDRSFYSVAAAWASCTSSPSDVKELIPEFFTDDGFLVNSKLLDLGVRQTGAVVDDVELPPWAEGSAHRFIELHRAALECEYVSQRLHHWIDLVFGYKQQGAAAAAADNLFYPLTYQGAVDIDAVQDPVQRASMEAQVSEFGQTPKQLFSAPHPARLPRAQWTDSNAGRSLSSPVLGGSSDSGAVHGAADDGSVGADLGFFSPAPRVAHHMANLHREAVTGLAVNDHHILSVSRDGSLRVHERAARRPMRATDDVAGGAPLSCCQLVGNDAALVGSWDSSVYVYSIAYNRCTDQLAAHDDAVNSLCMRDDLLVTGGSDTLVRLWRARPSGFESMPLMELAHLEAAVCGVDVCGPLFVGGGANGHVLLGDSRIPGGLIRVEHASVEEACMAVRFLSDGRHCVCGSRVISFGTSGSEMALPLRGDSSSMVTCVDRSDALVGAGLQSGCVQLFDCVGGGARLFETLGTAPAPLASLAMLAGTRHVYAGCQDGSCIIWAE